MFFYYYYFVLCEYLAGLSLSFDLPVALIFTPITNVLPY